MVNGSNKFINVSVIIW